MRTLSALILLTVLVTSSAGSVLAQDALNETGAVNDTEDMTVANIAPVVEAAAPLEQTVEAAQAIPQEAASRFKQLSTFVKGETTVLGKNTAPEYMDVSKTANRDTVFTREAGASTPAVKVAITKVNTAEDKYVQVTNQAVGSWNLMGWTLASAGNTTFTFPELTLEEESFVRVHEGEGVNSKSDIYSNSTNPLWIDNLVSLQDADGKVGLITVTTKSGSKTLNVPDTLVEITESGTHTSDAMKIDHVLIDSLFSDSQKALPKEPVNFVFYFLHNTTELTAKSRSLIPEVLSIIRELELKKLYYEITIIGHTDTTGGDDYNIKLSSVRAESVREILTSHSIRPDRIELRYHGSRDPAILTEDNVKEPLNRRVEVVVK